MPILIAISRRYPSLPAATGILASLPPGTIALLGDNPGTEQRLILSLFTHRPDIHQVVYHADWAHHHSAARSIRDGHMLADCDQVLALTAAFNHDSDQDQYFLELIHRAYRDCIPTAIHDPHLQLLRAQPSLYDFNNSEQINKTSIDIHPARCTM